AGSILFRDFISCRSESEIAPEGRRGMGGVAAIFVVLESEGSAFPDRLPPLALEGSDGTKPLFLAEHVGSVATVRIEMDRVPRGNRMDCGRDWRGQRARHGDTPTFFCLGDPCDVCSACRYKDFCWTPWNTQHQ